MNTVAEETIANFTKLKGKTFAEYNIIYHINDCFSVNELASFHGKHQLLFQKFESKIQQMNLVLIDSLFPIILADVALDVFPNDVSSFNEYIKAKKTITVIDTEKDREYFKHKFFTFIHHLLYSEISSGKICNGEIQTDNIYCLKNDFGELQFYSIYEQSELQLMLLERLKLEINFDSSNISKEEVKLNFQIRFI